MLKIDNCQQVRVESFGRDHWSVLAYIETRIVDNEGVPDFNHMRTSATRHPMFLGSGQRLLVANGGYAEYPTTLKGGELLPNHDDWDCAEDLESAGFIKNCGTGLNPQFMLTKIGKAIVSKLRQHKGDGGTFSSFVLEI